MEGKLASPSCGHTGMCPPDTHQHKSLLSNLPFTSGPSSSTTTQYYKGNHFSSSLLDTTPPYPPHHHRSPSPSNQDPLIHTFGKKQTSILARSQVGDTQSYQICGLFQHIIRYPHQPYAISTAQRNDCYTFSVFECPTDFHTVH